MSKYIEAEAVVPVSDRRLALTDAEEAALLVAVKAMFENGTKIQCEQNE